VTATLQAAADALPSPAPAVARFQCHATVLVVEDNAVNQMVAKRTLERMGCTVHVANDGLEALHALDVTSFDLVLMDCHMPGLDGYDTTRELRRREANTRRVPVVAFTANALLDDRAACLAAGMDDYASKPIRPATLQLLLARWLPPALIGPR
jgi:CheY-like chemotaxis protein